MNISLIKKYIEVIRRATNLLEQQMSEDVSEVFDKIASEIPNSPVRTSVAPVVASIVDSGPTEEEKEKQKQHLVARGHHIDALLGINCWPVAIPQHQASAKATEADNINRANAVLDSCLATSVEGAHFLDYGCGDGYIASQVAMRGANSITGYDIVPSDHWQRLDNEIVKYTTDVNDLTPKGYNIIFLYDVLDHCADPIGVMSHIKYLAKPGAIVYVKCHPWTSRHASHLPKYGLNYAYMHMFLSHEELVDRGFKPLFTRIEKNPMEAYHWWFKDFKIIKEKPIYDGVNGFFHEPAFKELLAVEQQLKPDEIDPFLERMKLQYIEYTLEA
jgi:SAM-dependent methyltransferase